MLGGVLVLGFASESSALETDQYYAWTRPLPDVSEAVNTEINTGIKGVLDRVNARRQRASCGEIERAVHDRFKFIIVSKLELRGLQTLPRAPADGDEEIRYLTEWLYGGTFQIDQIHWMPPSPTIEVAEVRMGTDKLSHFLSGGGWAARAYRRAARDGTSEDEAVGLAMRSSITAERTVLGQSTSGIFSTADLEANFQGLMFYRGLCEGVEPRVVATPGGWRLERRVDIREYVTPEWDESWQPNVYSKSRWKKVRPVMRRHCGELGHPEVQKRRAAYSERDRETRIEAMVRELVAGGKLADPAQFTIDAVCAPAAGTGSTE